MRHLRHYAAWVKYNWIILLDIAKTLMLGVLLIIAISLLSHMANQNQQIKSLSQQNQVLARQIKGLSEQNNDLSKQNKALSEQNQRYQRCNFLAFAHFTQTHRPVQDSEIDSCILLATLPVSANSGSTSSATSRNSSHGTSSSASTNPTPNPMPPQPDSSHDPVQKATKSLNSVLKRINPLK